MDPLNLFEDEPGYFSLTMYTGELPTDEVVQELNHEPNGAFWDGVAEWLVRTRVPSLAGRFEYNSEGGMFCAFGRDSAALTELGEAMREVVISPDRVRALIVAAEAADFYFDD